MHILIFTKLQRIDKNTNYHPISMLFCLFHQGKMTGVQVTHGGHQGNPATFTTPTRHMGTQLGDCVYHQHRILRPIEENRGLYNQ